MKHYKENTLKTYANKLTNKFKNECDFVVATTDIHSDLVIGAMVNYKNNGIKSNRYDVTIWTLENGNINIEIYKNDDRLKAVYKEIEVTSLNYALDVIYDIISNDNSDEIEKLETSEATEETNVKDVMEVKQNLNTEAGKEISKTPSVLDVMQCMMCKADRQGNRCGGKEWCNKTWNRYGAIINPEWHHVSLATLANIDNDMLDEKRRVYMKIYRMTANIINTMYKCNKLSSIDTLRRRLISTVEKMWAHKVITYSLVHYVKAKIDNCYLVVGLLSSMYASSYSDKVSRTYKKVFYI